MLHARSMTSIPCRVFACAVLIVLPSAIASAEVIDLSLNVLYTNPQYAPGGGTWELVAKSDGFGLVGVKALLTNIDAGSVVNAGPRGTVNDTDPAGIQLTAVPYNGLGYTEVNSYQLALRPEAPVGDEQTVFYGIGTLDNGAPNYPGQPMGTNSIGPAFTSLTVDAGEPWGLPDSLNEAEWDGAALLATGPFSGEMPGFYSDSLHKSTGNTFTSVGTSTNFGSISNPLIEATTVVRTNLVQTADYNHNGVVDAADYVVWRKTLGSTTMLDADGDSSGTIDEADYEVWRMDFGTVFGPGSGSSLGAAAVPEPTAAAILAVGAAFSLGSLRSRSRRSDPRKSAPGAPVMMQARLNSPT
jgi:hypothetical protein